jgi:hypothetical protein
MNSEAPFLPNCSLSSFKLAMDGEMQQIFDMFCNAKLSEYFLHGCKKYSSKLLNEQYNVLPNCSLSSFKLAMDGERQQIM